MNLSKYYVLGVKVKELVLRYMISDFLHSPTNRKGGAISKLSKENRIYHLETLN